MTGWPSDTRTLVSASRIRSVLRDTGRDPRPGTRRCVHWRFTLPTSRQTAVSRHRNSCHLPFANGETGKPMSRAVAKGGPLCSRLGGCGPPALVRGP